MNKHQGESAPLNSSADAIIARQAFMTEVGKLEGVYQASCLRVIPGEEKWFMPMWNRQQFLERKAQRLFARVLPPMMRAIREEIADITDLMRRHQFVVWEESFPNTVATVGKNLGLDTFLAGSSYTVTGPYMGLISSVSYTATAAADTMASHSGWTEAGITNAPTYSAGRKTAAWSSASAGAKALSSALSFSITGTGTIKGAFLVYGSGAVSTVDNTSGVLMSAGVFSGGDKVVASSDVVNVSYSLAF